MSAADEIQKVTKATADFLKIAFCIDGECTFEKFESIRTEQGRELGQVFKLTDSTRGVFHVTISKK